MKSEEQLGLGAVELEREAQGVEIKRNNNSERGMIEKSEKKPTV